MNITSCSKNASVRNAVVYIIKERKYIFKFKDGVQISIGKHWEGWKKIKN